MNVLNTLEGWLAYIGSLHRIKIDLGLQRVREVAERLDLLSPDCPVITIGGTNGKGSCVAGLEAIYRAQGYRVGAFTSPYLFRHNEEVRINGVEASDEVFCEAFARIEAARGDISLTPFEFNTLAALDIFRANHLDVILLEVGLGGRLDAVNILDADLAVITSIGIDHVDWLGDTRELIGKEKAGIFRPGRVAVCGDFAPPQLLVEVAAEQQTVLFCQGKDFDYCEAVASWSWQSGQTAYQELPVPSLALQNMSTVLMVVEQMQEKLPVSRQAIDFALKTVALPGRIQVLPGDVTRIIDVSHNPAAAAFLAKKLGSMPCQGKTRAVFSMLKDKDILGTLQEIKSVVDAWYVAELTSERRASREQLKQAFSQADIVSVVECDDIARAYHAAMSDSTPEDRVIVFGSFYTVAGVLSHIRSEPRPSGSVTQAS